MVKLEPKVLGDVPLTAYSDRPTPEIRTGTWKYLEPRYEDKLPPCAQACPAGNDISHLLSLVAQGDLAGAAQTLRAGNPLPATLGRVCPHFCQQACNRESLSLGGAIAMNCLERFLGELPADAPPCEPATGRKVAVIGAGPAGIACAWVLARAGHEVHVFDDKPQPGGFLRTGIPSFRLPKDVLDREIGLVRAAGVRFHLSTRIGSEVDFEELRRRFNAVVVAVGLHASRPLDIPGIEQAEVFHGVDLLERIQANEPLSLPKQMAVVGGDNTAIDAARSLLRLGSEVTVVYRRTEAEMPAIASEIQQARTEGVHFHFLAAPTRILTRDNRMAAMECRRMRLENATPPAAAPVPISGSEFLLLVSESF